MRTSAARRLLSLALFALCLGLAGVIYAQVTGELRLGPATPAVAEPSAADTAMPVPARPETAFVPPPIHVFSAIVERPLFSPTRRPPAAPALATQPAVRPRLDHLALIGVLISADGRVALLEQPRSPSILEAREGETVEGWTVESIAADSVMLRWQDSRHTLTFEKETASPARRTPGARRPAVPGSTPGRVRTGPVPARPTDAEPSPASNDAAN